MQCMISYGTMDGNRKRDNLSRMKWTRRRRRWKWRTGKYSAWIDWLSRRAGN